jgi:hypothetical protein
MTSTPIAPPVRAPKFKEVRPTFTPAQEKAFKKLTAEQKKELRNQGLMWGLIAADAAEGGTQSLLQVFLDAAKDGLLDGTPAAQQALQVRIKQSAWGRQYSSTQEQFMLLKYQYPEEFDALMNGTKSVVGGKEVRTPGTIEWVKNTALSLGAQLSDQEILDLAESILMNKYTDKQAEKLILGYVDFEQADLLGKVGINQDSLSKYAKDFGITLTPQQQSKYIQDILFDRTSLNDVVDTFRRDSAKQYANFSDRIMSGETVEDVLTPYKKLFRDVLEVPDVDLSDNLMLDVLSGKNPDGSAKYASTSDFKRALKSDPRWQQTNNARDAYFGIGKRILQDFGFLG